MLGTRHLGLEPRAGTLRSSTLLRTCPRAGPATRLESARRAAQLSAPSGRRLLSDPLVVADGFTNIIDITFDGSGRLIVLEMSTNGLLSGDSAGALWRVAPDGSHTLLASKGLVTPGGAAIGSDGAYYVTNNSALAGVVDGEVLRITTAAASSMSTSGLPAEAGPGAPLCSRLEIVKVLLRSITQTARRRCPLAMTPCGWAPVAQREGCE